MKTAVEKTNKTELPTQRYRSDDSHPHEPVKQAQRIQIREILRTPTIQPKMVVGAPDDKYEREADRVADEVMRVKDRPIDKPRELIDEKHNIPQNPESILANSCSSGRPLCSNIERIMGNAMKSDFKRVRVHSDSVADRFNRALHARAFTVGENIYFRQGEYNPETLSGRRLLAHELAHVVQQTNAQSTLNRDQRDNIGTPTMRTTQPMIQCSEEEFSVQTIPAEYASQITSWETELNTLVQSRVSSRTNAFALRIIAIFRHYAVWLQTHQPAEVDHQLFNNIVDIAVNIACDYLPGMNTVVKNLVKAGINAVKNAVKEAVRDGLAADTTWRSTQQRLETGGANLILGLTEAGWAQDFPGWLSGNCLAEYDRVHRDFRERMVSGTTGGTWAPSALGGEVNRWLTALGVPDPEDRVFPRMLLMRLIAQTRLAQIAQRAQSRLLPGLQGGEERMFWQDLPQLERLLNAEGLREAHRRLR